MTEDKLIKYLESAEYLDTKNTDLFNKPKDGIIHSHEFIRKSTKHILDVLDYLDKKTINVMLYEYTNVLAELIKYETACKIQKTLNNL